LIAFLFCLRGFVAAQTALEARIEQHFRSATEAEKKGDYEKAITEYQAVLKLDPKLAEVSSNLGLLYYIQRKDQEAARAFQYALDRKPDLVVPNLFLGMVYLRTNQYQKAIEPLKKAIALGTNDTRAYLHLSLAYVELGKQMEAMEILQKAAALWPQDVEILYHLGTVYTGLMTTTYGKTAQLDPDSYRVHQLLGASYEARKDPRKAIEEYKLAIAKKSDLAGLHYALGNVYWKNGDLEKA